MRPFRGAWISPQTELKEGFGAPAIAEWDLCCLPWEFPLILLQEIAPEKRVSKVLRAYQRIWALPFDPGRHTILARC